MDAGCCGCFVDGAASRAPYLLPIYCQSTPSSVRHALQNPCEILGLLGPGHAPLLADMELVLFAEALDAALHRPHGRIAQRAEALAGDVVADVQQAGPGPPLVPGPARCAAGSCTSSRCLRGRGCTCRTIRDGRKPPGAPSARTMQVCSLMTITAPEPSIEPASKIDS